MATKIRLERSPMGRLNDDLLLAVLQKLADPADRQAWCMVCKSFRKLEARLRYRVRLVKVERLAAVLRRFPCLEHLDLSLTQKVTDESLALVAKHAGEKLRSLNLSKVGGFSEVGFFHVARACNALMEVDLSNCSDLKDGVLLALSQMRNLRVLNLSGCRRVTDLGLGCLAAGCSALEELSLKYCMSVTDIGVTMVAACCRRLRSLDLSFTEVSNRGLEIISSLPDLLILHLVRCTNIDDVGLCFLETNCKSLQNLDISNCPMVTDFGLISFAEGNKSLRQLALSHVVQATLLTSFKKFSNLQVVSLDGCEVSAEGLAVIGMGCTDLKELSLSKSIGVTDSGIEAVVSKCTGLHKLDLACCREITDLALSYITTTCKDLLILRMESCGWITDCGLAHLSLGCPVLEELDFTDTLVTDIGVKSVSRCSSLRLLKLGICLNITDLGVEHLGAGCRNLREVDMYRSAGVGDVGIAAIAAGCPRLKAVNLSYCNRITDCAMRSLSQLTELHHIEIRGCTLVTSIGLTFLSAGCKRLIDIDFKHCIGVGDQGILALVRGCTNIRQINVSNTLITNIGLLALANLNCLLNLKILHMKNVSFDCYEKVLLACTSLKKVKLLFTVREAMAVDVLQSLESRGCRMRWMLKPDFHQSVPVNCQM